MSHSHRLIILLICTFPLFLSGRALAQGSTGSKLEKMPADLETAYALSALPPHLRAGATVYLLDPAKGYYIGRQGSNGFVCLIARTEWEWGEFRNDIFTPIGFDPAGARTTFQVYKAVAAMRASGMLTALQVRDSVVSMIRKGKYGAPAREGIAYMLAPVMRVYTGNPGDETVMTMSMPHYMFYAPYLSSSDVGIINDNDKGPLLLNPGNTVLGKGKGPYGYIIMAANDETTAKLMADGKDLLKRLAAYSAYFKLDASSMHH